jgi:hypothetical protein
VTIGHNAPLNEAGMNLTSEYQKQLSGLFLRDGLDKQSRLSRDLPVGQAFACC